MMSARSAATPVASCRPGAAAGALPTSAPLRPGCGLACCPSGPSEATAPSPAWAPPEETPSLGTARDGGAASCLYMAPALDSVKRHLGDAFPSGGSSASASAAPKKQRSKLIGTQPPLSASGAELLVPKLLGAAASLPVHGRDDDPVDERLKPHIEARLPSLSLTDGGAPPSVLDGLPELEGLNLPTATATRMQERRAWLQRLLLDELARAQRAASTGAASAFELACGLQPSEPLPPRAAAAMFSATLHKFEVERDALVNAERIEIEALQAAAC